MNPPPQHEASSPPAPEEAAPVAENWGDNPMFVRSYDAFYRNLPELLKKHDRKWAAYHGDELVGIARTETELFEFCLRNGLKLGEFAVLYIHTGALSDNDEESWRTTDSEGRTFWRE